MRLVMVDAIYDDLTSNLSYPMDRAVKSFIDSSQPPFIIARSDFGEQEREKRRTGRKVKKGNPQSLTSCRPTMG